MRTLGGLRSRYHAIARALGAPTEHVRFTTAPRHDGGPHIEQRGGDFSYVVTERGAELERRSTSDPDDILYWLISDLTRAMASDWEVAHREGGVDSRRLLFSRHIELLARARPPWALRKQREYDEILRAHPFVDGGG